MLGVFHCGQEKLFTLEIQQMVIMSPESAEQLLKCLMSLLTDHYSSNCVREKQFGEFDKAPVIDGQSKTSR